MLEAQSHNVSKCKQTHVTLVLSLSTTYQNNTWISTTNTALWRGYSQTRRDCKRITSGSTGFNSSISFSSIVLCENHNSLAPSISIQCREIANLICGSFLCATRTARFVRFRVRLRGERYGVHTDLVLVLCFIDTKSINCCKSMIS